MPCFKQINNYNVSYNFFLKITVILQVAVTILIIAAVDKFARGRAINNGLSLKLNPINGKNNTGMLFPKIPQEAAHEYRLDVPSKAYISDAAALSSGVSTYKQVAKVVLPNITSTTNTGMYEPFIKIPIVWQPFSDYKIVIATAPWKMRIKGGDMKPVVVYFVFPEDYEDPSDRSVNIPEIYFVKKGYVRDIIKKDLFKPEPFILIDNNRTVTGLKSNTVAKFVKFKNKLNSHDNNKAVRR